MTSSVTRMAVSERILAWKSAGTVASRSMVSTLTSASQWKAFRKFRAWVSGKNCRVRSSLKQKRNPTKRLIRMVNKTSFSYL